MRGKDIYGPGFWKGGPGPANCFRGMGMPFSFCRYNSNIPARLFRINQYINVDSSEELEYLKMAAGSLKNELESVNRRIAALEK